MRGKGGSKPTRLPPSPLTPYSLRSMCYALFLASPLTLSEIRSMLPAALAADLLDPASQRLLKKRHPDAQTGAALLRGRCSCALVQEGAADGVWEAELRKRYRAVKASRGEVIKALDRHRAIAELRMPRKGTIPKLFEEFVIEHAKNAGASMYYLRFGTEPFQPLTAVPAPKAQERSTALSAEWLREGEPVVVVL